MTLKKKLAIAICSAFAFAPVSFAQTGGAVEGTTSPQSGSQTDMGTDGTSNSRAGSGSNSGTNSSTGGDSGTNSPSKGVSGTSSSTGGDSGASSSTSGASGTTSSTGGASGAGSSSSGAAGSGSSNSGTAGSGASDGAASSTSGNSTTTPSTSGASSGSSTTGAASTATPDPASGESFDAKLKGKSVYNENDEKVGDVKDLVMSADGKVTHVILGVGGFVGVGEHPVAIPYDEINQTGDRVTLQGYTKDQLKEMPAYEYPKDERAPASAPATSGASPMGPR